MSVLSTSKFQSVNELSQALREATSKKETAFLLIDDELFMVMPAEAARERIAEKIAQRLAENPSILHDLQSRLESEKPEDWD